MNKKLQLPLQTANLVVGLMVWVLISALLPFIREDIAIPAEKLAIVTAVPVVLGSILRIPLGYYANIFGARIIFFVSFILLLFPAFYISAASTFVDLIVGGTFLGIGGAWWILPTFATIHYSFDDRFLFNRFHGILSSCTCELGPCHLALLYGSP